MITISIPTKNTKIEIAESDLGPMTWDEANSACESTGDGWRLPTTLELDTMCKEIHKKGDGNFSPTNYWSGTSSTLFNKMGAYNFERSAPFADHVKEEYHVRLVREI
jgi:hypothetical protein